MMCVYCKCAIDLATTVTDRSKTLVDHIYFNKNKCSYINGVLITDLSNQLGTFIAVSAKKSTTVKSKIIKLREMSNFNFDKLTRNRYKIRSLKQMKRTATRN